MAPAGFEPTILAGERPQTVRLLGTDKVAVPTIILFVFVRVVAVCHLSCSLTDFHEIWYELRLIGGSRKLLLELLGTCSKT